MIVYKQWQEHKGELVRKSWACDGWFLFGLIPLYIRKHPL